MKVLLVGHVCHPNYGSEPGITWNWAWEMSKTNDVWLIAHPRFRKLSEEFLANHPNHRLRIVWLSLPATVDPWKPERGERGIKLHYALWQRLAYKSAVALHHEHNFDLIHQMSWNTISIAPRFWKIGVPFIWGPLGGGQVVPIRFLPYFGRAFVVELLRTLRVQSLRWMPSFRRAVQNATMVLAINDETAAVLKQGGAKNIPRFLDVGIPDRVTPTRPPQRRGRDTFVLLWAGTLEPRKGLPLALEAVSLIADHSIRLVIAGDGPNRWEYERLVDHLGIRKNVQFLGRVEWSQLSQVFLQADAFIFTSLRDSSGTVLVEAMAHALPVITLDHQGARLIVPADAGKKIPVTTPKETVESISAAISMMASDENLRIRMGEVAWESAQQHKWSMRAEKMARWWQECTRPKVSGE